MGDTLYSKQSHSNGPRVGLYDIPGTSTDTLGGNFIGGPYAEKAHLVPDDGNGNSLILIEGWDPANLVARKIKVDTAGAVYIANPGGGTGTGGGGEVTSGTAANFLATVFQGTASNLNATVVGTVTALPNGTQAVSGAVTVSGTTTTVPSGTQAVSQTGSPWGVSGTVTAQGTVAVTQVTSPWVVSGTVVPNGTVTIIPSGTQTVAGTVTSLLSGTAAVTQSTTPWLVANNQSAAVSTAWGSGASLNSTSTLVVTNYASVTLSYNPTAGVTGGGAIFEASDDAGTTWYTLAGIQNGAGFVAQTSTVLGTTLNSWDFDVAGFTTFRVRLNPVVTGTGTATFRMQATAAAGEPSVVVGQATAANLNATVVGTVTVTPSGTQTVSGTVAATQSTSPWVVSQGTASNLKALANIGSTFNTGQVTVGTATGTTILASNASRIKLTLINTGTNAAYISTATTVTSTTGQYLAGIAGYPMAFRSTTAVCGIAAASTVTITYLEEVI